MGVVEFKMEATALSISVSAKAKRKAGIKVPRNAEIAIHFHSLFLIFLIELKPINNKKAAANNVRNAPNCKGVRPINAFLISIKELPHTIDSMTRYTHFVGRFFIVFNSEFGIQNYELF
ncbi:MAG: hypothetical protein ACJAX3_000625 [Patiriisocius sp.]|jgi:hypothetical protein